jgi:hypothetical protein
MEMRNVHTTLVENSDGEDRFGGPNVDGTTILKLILKREKYMRV